MLQASTPPRQIVDEKARKHTDGILQDTVLDMECAWYRRFY